jgi:hypothetical protein
MFSRSLGFDMRLGRDKYVSSQWSQERRQRYLLNPEVFWPLSVDQTVWPTIFLYNRDATAHDLELTICVEPRDAHQDALELWANPTDMYKAARQSGAPIISEAVPISVELISSAPLIEFDYWRAVLDQSYTVAPTSAEWVCLGYDVADSSRLSGLANCSYKDADRHDLSRDWGTALNEFGLFREPVTALEFARLTDRRVPEHAPFFAYGLYSNRAR